MAATITPVDRFRDIGWIETDLTATGSSDILNGPCTVYAMRFINTGGGAVHAHIKVYDAVGATNVTRPLLAFPIAGAQDRIIYFGAGLRFPIGCTIRATTGVMNHTGSDGSDPAVDVAVHVIGQEG